MRKDRNTAKLKECKKSTLLWNDGGKAGQEDNPPSAVYFCRCREVFLSFFSAPVPQQGSLIAFFYVFLVSPPFSGPPLLEMKFSKNHLSLVIYKTRQSYYKVVLNSVMHRYFFLLGEVLSFSADQKSVHLIGPKIQHSELCLIRIIQLWNLKCCLKSYPIKMTCNLHI